MHAKNILGRSLELRVVDLLLGGRLILEEERPQEGSQISRWRPSTQRAFVLEEGSLHGEHNPKFAGRKAAFVGEFSTTGWSWCGFGTVEDLVAINCWRLSLLPIWIRRSPAAQLPDQRRTVPDLVRVESTLSILTCVWKNWITFSFPENSSLSSKDSSAFW